MNDRIGQQFGNYRLLRLLGRGGFAEVYLGQHIRISTQQAAIKILTTRMTEDDIHIFTREAETISSLVNPRIIRLLDFDVAGGVPFLVMDYAPNGSLRQRHRRGEQVPLPVVVDYVRQIAEGLQYAHDKKIIHRDIKPDNMLLGLHNEIVLSDFGIATIAHNTSSMSSQAASGTIPYMAPEQIQSYPRPASDQYALGITAYEWLTGERPFQGAFGEIVAKQLATPPPPLREKLPLLVPDVEQVILHALAKEPQQRFATVSAFARALGLASQSAPRSSWPSQSIIPTAPAESVIPTTPAERAIPTAPSQNPPAPSQPPPAAARQLNPAVFTGPVEVNTPVTPMNPPASLPEVPVTNSPIGPIFGEVAPIYPSEGTPTPPPSALTQPPETRSAVEPGKRPRASTFLLFISLLVVLLGGAVSYPLWSRVIFSGGLQGTPTTSSSSSQGGTHGSTAVSGNASHCKKIGLLLPDSISTRWDTIDKPALEQQISQALPGAVVDYKNAQGSSATQLTQAESGLASGDCVLVVAAVDSLASAQIVTEAKAKNVPVISYDRLIQSKDLAYYVSFDPMAVGKVQGQYIADHYKDFVTAGHVNTAMINGSQTDNSALLFSQGAHSVLDPLYSSGVLKKVYEQWTPGWDNTTAQTEIEAALTANNSDIQIAYVANDGMANSVIAALKAQSLNGKILVTGQDATVAGIQNILMGDQAMTVEKNFTLEARSTADLIAALSNGTSTVALTSNAITTTSDGGRIPSVLDAPLAIDHTNFQQVVTDGLLSKADICQGLPANAKYLPAGFCG